MTEVLSCPEVLPAPGYEKPSREKEKPSVINAALSAVEIEDFLVIFSSVMVAIFLKTNNNKLRTQ